MDIKYTKPEDLSKKKLTISIQNDPDNNVFPIYKDDHLVYKENSIEYEIADTPIGEPLETTLKASAVVASSASNSLVVLAMAINLPIAVYLMKLIQFTSYLNLINIPFPQNLEDFLEVFKTNVFDFLEIKPIGELECTLKNRFKEEEMDCSFINSCFIPIMMLAILGILKFIVKSMFKGSKVPDEASIVRNASTKVENVKEAKNLKT
jgi:hypothetical protein